MDQKARTRFQSMATAVAVVLTLTLAAGAGCDSRQEPKLESVKEKLEASHLNGQIKLRIGVPSVDASGGELGSAAHIRFDYEIARYIADSLGYAGDERIEFKPLDTEDRIPALQGGQVDLVVASLSKTEEREKLIGFAGPYLVTTQEVMVPTRLQGRIQTIEDLRNPAYRICVSGGSTSQRELGEYNIRVRVAKSVDACVQGIRRNEYDVVSSDEAILAGFRSRYPTEFEIVDLPFGTSESIGVGVPISDPDLRDLVAFFLQKSYRMGRNGQTSPWLTAYNKTLGPWLKAVQEQPPPERAPDLVDFDDKAPTR